MKLRHRVFQKKEVKKQAKPERWYCNYFKTWIPGTPDREWKPTEVIEIIRLQTCAQGLICPTSVRGFYQLWEKQRGCCALTGNRFCQGGFFDVGIDIIDSSKEFTFDNTQLVLFPLSYIKSRVPHRSPSHPSRYDKDRESGRLAFVLLDQIIGICDQIFYDFPINYIYTSFGLGDWFRLELRYLTYDVRYLQKFHDLYIQRITINNGMMYTDHTEYDLSTPGCDPIDKIITVLQQTLISRLLSYSLAIIKQWHSQDLPNPN